VFAFYPHFPTNDADKILVPAFLCGKSFTVLAAKFAASDRVEKIQWQALKLFFREPHADLHR
jgi:hypothetical protein